MDAARIFLTVFIEVNVNRFSFCDDLCIIALYFF